MENLQSNLLYSLAGAAAVASSKQIDLWRTIGDIRSDRLYGAGNRKTFEYCLHYDR